MFGLYSHEDKFYFKMCHSRNKSFYKIDQMSVQKKSQIYDVENFKEIKSCHSQQVHFLNFFSFILKLYILIFNIRIE